MRVRLNRTHHVPQRYLPRQLTKRDRTQQRKALLRSRKAYQQQKYVLRPKIKSFHSRRSSHLDRVAQIYDIYPLRISKTLAMKTGCTRKALRKIVNKGRGAYYSSGSRPNQTPESWGVARLASAITGGPASGVDYDILVKGCTRRSKALRLAKQPQSLKKL